jgi:outer membrane receptor for ferrienterochelin and colicins
MKKLINVILLWLSITSAKAQHLQPPPLRIPTKSVTVSATNEKKDSTILKSRLETETQQLSTVQITTKRGDNMVSALDPRNVERIGSNELKKAPCCNLSESFETNGTVDVKYADAVTGAKEIQLLGLRGIYTQLMVENRPDFYGLATPFALEYLPGTWLSGIEISKGAGSVKNGMQAITGQINTDLQLPSKDAPLFINVYGEQIGRLEANVHLNKVVNPNFSHNVLLHGSTFQNKLDHNSDGFIDMPLKKQFNGMYRAFFEVNEKWVGRVAVQALTETRLSGQLADNVIVTNPFKIDIKNNRISVSGKLGYLGFKEPYNTFGSQWAVTHHDVNALYGRNRYAGTQRSFYGNTIYSTIIGTSDHNLNLGASVQYDDYREKINEQDLSRVDALLGAFGEYTYNRPHAKGYNDITFIAGLRTDFHPKYGLFVSPRFNFKYNFNAGDVLRFAAGRGVRVANPIAENVAFLATNRTIAVAADLKPEDAYNIGVNFVKTFKIFGAREARWSFDAYRTQFVNQVIADIETDYQKAQFYNLKGKSYANTFLTMLNLPIFNGLDVKLAYKFNDVKATYNNLLLEVPLVAKHRSLFGIDYKTPNKKWLFNWTTQFIGQQRMANRSYVPANLGVHAMTYSPKYTLTHTSVNFFWKNMEFYTGAENLLGYTQHQPIMVWQDPTSAYFDATQIYAPMMGRRIYAGFRFRLGQKTD